MKKFLLISIIMLSSFVFAQDVVFIEKSTYQVTVSEFGTVDVRRTTRIYRNGLKISKRHTDRHIFVPGSSLVQLEILVAAGIDHDKEVARIKAIALAAWTPEVMAAHATRSVGSKAELKDQ